MKKFFLASFLIVLSGLLIGLYYYFRQIYRNKSQHLMKESINKKIKTDEKEYLRNYLMYSLPLLKANDIQWIMIWSRLEPSQKVEITFNFITNEIQIIIREVKIRNDTSLMNMGINRVTDSSDSQILKLAANAKIITDVIYYLFECYLIQKKFANYKIATSASRD